MRCAGGIAGVMRVFCDAASERQRAPLMAISICKNKQKIKLLADRTTSGNLLHI
jgi:hypothetical protein